MVPTLFSDSPAMRPVVALIGRAAAGRAGVLIRGEDGTGRRVVAQIIHAMDARSGPFVSVDCARHDADALETLLFGGAAGARDGLETVTSCSRLAQASGGTLHVRNLAEASARVQHRLARVLRDREAVGPSGEVVALEVRPMVSAGPEIDAAVADGRIRGDLFQRFAVIDINVPPLRKRREDIPALARHFVGEICAAQGLSARVLSRSATALVTALPWHGNATELRGLLETVVSAHAGASEISVEALLEHICLDGGAAAVVAAGETLREARARFERDYISAVLGQHHGRISDAARALGIQRTNLYRKLRHLRVPREARPQGSHS